MNQNFKRKLLAGLLSACMMLQTIGTLPVYAAGNVMDSGLPIGTSSVCTHHVHDEKCGYKEGAPCTHEHTDECSAEVKNCVHEHTAECYPVQDSGEATGSEATGSEATGSEATGSEATGSEAKEPTACTHICSGENGCITKELACKHVHDNACGYKEGTPCTFDTATCESCNPKDSNAQELPKEDIAKAETISEPAPLAKTANTVELNIKDGAIKIFSDRYEIYNGSNWTETAYTGSYVITGTEQGNNPGRDYITVLSLATDATLTLKDLTIESTKNQSALSLAGLPSVPGGEASVPEVCIEGTVKLGGLQTAIKANGALNLTGSGSLALEVVNSNSQSQNATAVISAASVAANLGGDITVTATSGGADIHAIHTTAGEVSLTSNNGKVSLTSSGTTAPLIMSAGAVTISGYGDVAVTTAGGPAIIADGQNVSMTSKIGKVDVIGNGNSPAILAGAVTISGYRDVSVESTGGPAIIAGGGAVSLTSESGWVKVTGKGNGPAIQASAVTISGKTDVVVTSTGGGSGISASGEVFLTSKSSVIEVRSTQTAISSGKLTIHGNGSVLVSSTGNDPAISASGEVSLTSDNSNVDVNGNGGISPAILASTLTIAAKGLVTVENGNADNAIRTTDGAVSLNANDIYIGGLIFGYTTVTFTAPEGAMVTSESADQLITGTVTVAENTQLKLLGNTEGITYANDGSEGRTTAYAGDLSGGGAVSTVGTYIAGNGTIVVTRSDDGNYTATMTNATVGNDLEFNDNCTITLVGQNKVENGLYLLNNDKYLTLTINGTGELFAQNINADNITISGGTVNAVSIYSNSNSKNGTISITDGTVNAANISSEGDNGTISITGGTVNADTIVTKTPSITGGTVNAIVQNITIEEKSVTVYGNVTLTQDLVDLPGTSTFTAPAGTSLTVPSGVKLYLIYCTGDGETAGTNAITNKGTMTINGELMLPNAFNSKSAIAALNLTGSGNVKVSNGEEQPATTYTTYFTDGSQPHTSNTALTFTTSADAGNLENDGYEWKKDTKTLTLKNLWLEVSNGPKAIILPDGAKLVLQGTSTVIGKDSAIYANGNLTVSGATGILKAGYTSNTSGNSIEVEETLTVDSGTIWSAGKDASMCANAIEIKDGTIDLGAHGTMTAMTTLTISGGNVTTGDNEASMCAKDIVITGGVVKTGASIQGSICAADLDGGTARSSITITGGTVIANGGNHPSTPCGILAMNGDISITGGTVTATGGIDIGSGVIVGGGIAAIDGTIDETITGTITTTGMTATTTPTGGKVASATVDMPSGNDSTIQMKFTSYTAEATLQAEGGFGMITNACTTVSLAKTQTPPDSGDSGSGGDSGSTGGGSTGGGSTGGGSTGAPTTVPTPAPTPVSTPKATDSGNDTQKPTAGKTTAAAEVDADGKATVKVPEKSITDAITKAQQTAKKNGTEQNGISVEIEVTSDENINSVSATLSEESIKELVDAGAKEVTFKSEMGDITLDLETLEQIQKEQGDDITISVSKTDVSHFDEKLKEEIGDRPVYELNLTRADGTRVTNFDGSITIAIPYTLKEGEDPENIAVVYINEKGEKEIMSGSRYDEKTQSVIFTTRHFSTFAIVLMPDKIDAPITDIEQTEDTTTDLGNGTETANTQGGISTGIVVTIVIAGILAIAIVAGGVFVIVKKRREESSIE